MMLINCTGCGTLIVNVSKYGGDLCSQCQHRQMEESRAIKDYLLDHPKASMIEVYHHTRIPLKRIRKIVQHD